MMVAARNRDRLLLGLIVAGGAAVRFFGLGFGLPHNGVRPDELTLIAKVMNFFSGDLNPHFFSYPSLLMYVLFALYNVYFLLGLAMSRFRSLDDFAGMLANDPSSFFLISRGLSALLGTLSIVAIYKVALRLFDRAVAMLAACFLAFAYLHVRDSHFGTTDIAVTFFVIMSYIYIAAYRSTPSRMGVPAGIFAGLAASTKYMGILLWVPMVLSHEFTPAALRPGLRRTLDPRLVLFGIAFAVAFLAGTPFALIEAARMKSDFAREVRSVWAMGHPLPPGWLYHLTVSLRYGLGAPLLAASLAGCLVLLRRDWKKACVFLSFPVLYYFLMGRGNRDFVRYAVPLLPFLCVTASVFLMDLHALARKRLPEKPASALLSATALLVLVPSIVAVLRFDALLSRDDTRVAARRYVEGSVPSGSSIVEFSAEFGYLGLSPTAASLHRQLESERREGLEPPDDPSKRPRVQASRRPGYRLWQYDPGSKEFLLDGKVEAGFPDYLVLEESPLRLYPARIPPEIRDLADRAYALKRAFLAYDGPLRSTVFNELDAFYVPFAGFTGYRRPGPNIFLYQRTR